MPDTRAWGPERTDTRRTHTGRTRRCMAAPPITRPQTSRLHPRSRMTAPACPGRCRPDLVRDRGRGSSRLVPDRSPPRVRAPTGLAGPALARLAGSLRGSGLSVRRPSWLGGSGSRRVAGVELGGPARAPAVIAEAPVPRDSMAGLFPSPVIAPVATGVPDATMFPPAALAPASIPAVPANVVPDGRGTGNPVAAGAGLRVEWRDGGGSEPFGRGRACRADPGTGARPRDAGHPRHPARGRDVRPGAVEPRGAADGCDGAFGSAGGWPARGR